MLCCWIICFFTSQGCNKNHWVHRCTLSGTFPFLCRLHVVLHWYLTCCIEAFSLSTIRQCTNIWENFWWSSSPWMRSWRTTPHWGNTGRCTKGRVGPFRCWMNANELKTKWRHLWNVFVSNWGSRWRDFLIAMPVLFSEGYWNLSIITRLSLPFQRRNWSPLRSSYWSWRGSCWTAWSFRSTPFSFFAY